MSMSVEQNAVKYLEHDSTARLFLGFSDCEESVFTSFQSYKCFTLHEVKLK